MRCTTTFIPVSAVAAIVAAAIIASLFALAALAGLATALVCLVAPADCAAAEFGFDEPFDIPPIEGIDIDGDAADWRGAGFRVAVLAAPDGAIPPPADFDVLFRVGWNERGLLVLAEVTDDEPRENADTDRLWRSDCIEIFIAEAVGHANRYQLVAASGADPARTAVRTRLYDHREARHGRAPLVDPPCEAKVGEGGYTIEALLPWENLGVEPRAGLVAALQLVANDEDGDGSLRVAWFPSYAAPDDPSKMHAVRLAERPSPPILCRVFREVREGRCVVVAIGAPETEGREAVVSMNNRIVARDVLHAEIGRAEARIEIQTPPGADRWPPMSVEIGGERIAAWEESPALERVLARYIEAAGGREAIGQLNSRAVAGRYLYDLPYADVPRDTCPLEGWSVSQDRWMIEVRGNGEIQRLGADGVTGWRQSGTDIRYDDRVRRGLIAFVLDPRGPLHINRFFPGMVFTGVERRGATLAIAVESRDGDRRRTLWFDDGTGLLSGVDEHLLLDYAAVDEVTIPHRIRSDRGNGYSAYEFLQIEHNVDTGGVQFAIPERADGPEGLFEGINDPAVLPMLRHLSFRHGGMNVPAEDGRFLYDLVRRNGYRRGLEIGTSNGYSTLWLGLAFRETGGRVITIEYEPLRAAEAAENFDRAGLGDAIDARTADAFAEIGRIEGLFDFVFIDAWKPDYIRYYRLLRERIRPGGAIAAHNVTAHESDMEEFLDAVKNDPDFETVIHRTSPAGISVSVRRRNR